MLSWVSGSEKWTEQFFCFDNKCCTLVKMLSTKDLDAPFKRENCENYFGLTQNIQKEYQRNINNSKIIVEVCSYKSVTIKFANIREKIL